MNRPVIALTMGDPAGIGPEICLAALVHPDVSSDATYVVIGDLSRLELAKACLSEATMEGHPSANDLVFTVITHPREASDVPNTVNVIDLHNVPSELEWGQIDMRAGKACFEYVQHAVSLANEGSLDAICTAPIHKEAWRLADIPYPGHTEALAALSGARESAMMLVNGKLRVVHVTTHVSLTQAISMATRERVLARIRLTDASLQRLGVNHPRIAVAGLNPHAGEHGLFGHEDETEIHSAIEVARSLGIDASGPWPPDSIFARAASGEFDVVIAQYHDQGHIAIKMLGFDSGINVTLGLPILRTSVDHGTAFDIAGQGTARPDSMVRAIQVAREFL